MQEAEKPNSGVIPDAGLAAAAADTISGLDKAAPVKPDWKLQPVSNFELDAQGRVKLWNGKPKPQSGRPRKPRPGDRLAGEAETVELAGGPALPTPAEAPAAGDLGGGVVDPDAGGAAGAAGGQEAAAEPGGVELGPEAAELAADALFNAAEALAGEKAKPTPKEAAAIKARTKAVIGQWRVWEPLALVVLVGVWIGRVWIQQQRQQQQGGGTSDPAYVHRRPDANGQVHTSSQPRWEYPKY